MAFYELLGICVAYKKQPEVSNTTKKETKNGSRNECSENTERAVIIEKNPEALLQRVRLIKNAKKEVHAATRMYQDQALVRRSPFDDEQLKKLADLRDHLSSKDN